MAKRELSTYWSIAIIALMVICNVCTGCNRRYVQNPPVLYTEIFDTILKQAILDYMAENQEDIRDNLMLLTISETTDTTIYTLCLALNFRDFLEPSVQFFAQVNNIYVGVKDLACHNMGMSIDGIAYTLKDKNPWIRRSYRIYRRSLGRTDVPPYHGLSTFIGHYPEWQLIYVNGKFVSKKISNGAIIL